MERRVDKQEALELLLKAKELGVRSIKVHGLEAEFFTPVSATMQALTFGAGMIGSPSFPVDTTHVHEKRTQTLGEITLGGEDKYNPHGIREDELLVPELKAEDLVKPTITLDDLTEEEILFAASEGLPDDKA